MEEKTKRTIIIMIVISIILFIFNIYKNSPNVRIKEYLTNRSFVLEQDKTFYYKQLSDKSKRRYEEDKKNNNESSYDYLYFDTHNKNLNEEIVEYLNKYETSLNIKYSFSNNKLKYIYRINYSDRKSAILEGTYNEKNDIFTCNKSFNHNIDINKYKESFCDYTKGYIESFIQIKNKLFYKSFIDNYLK